MVRLLIPLIAVFLIWLLFFSALAKNLRIGLSVAVIVATLFGLWLDTNGRGINTSRVDVSDVVSCGISGEFSYRANYNLSLCLKNKAERGTVERVQVRFAVELCNAGECQIQDTVDESINLSLPAGETIQLTENVAFKQLAANVKNPVFSANVIQVWASR